EGRLLLGGRLFRRRLLGRGFLRRRLIRRRLLGRLFRLVRRGLLGGSLFRRRRGRGLLRGGLGLGPGFLGGGLLRALLRGGRGFLGFDRRFQLLARDLALGHLGLIEQEIDHLVLVQRRAQLGLGHRLAADVFDEPLAVLGTVLLRRLLDQHAHFLAGDLDAVRLAVLRQQQAQSHAALGDVPVVVLLGLDFLEAGGGIVLLGDFRLELLPDL